MGVIAQFIDADEKAYLVKYLCISLRFEYSSFP